MSLHSIHARPDVSLGHHRSVGESLSVSLGRAGLTALLLVSSPATWGAPAPSAKAAPRSSERLPQASDEGRHVLWLSLLGCDPGPFEGACARIPDLLVQLEGVDPPAYVIHVSLGDQETICLAPACAVALLPTSPDGVEVKFWVESLSDKRKATYTASAQVLPAGDGIEDERTA